MKINLKSTRFQAAVWALILAVVLVALLSGGGKRTRTSPTTPTGDLHSIETEEQDLVTMLEKLGKNVVTTSVASSDHIKWFGQAEGAKPSGSWLGNVWSSTSPLPPQDSLGAQGAAAGNGLFLFQGTPGAILLETQPQNGTKIESSNQVEDDIDVAHQATQEVQAELRSTTSVTAFGSLKHLCQHHQLVFSKERKNYALAEEQVAAGDKALAKVNVEMVALQTDLDASQAELSKLKTSWTYLEILLGLATLSLLSAFGFLFEQGNTAERRSDSLADEVARSRETITLLQGVVRDQPSTLTTEASQDSITPLEPDVSAVLATPLKKTTTTSDSRVMSPPKVTHTPASPRERSSTRTPPVDPLTPPPNNGASSRELSLLSMPSASSASAAKKDMKVVRAQFREMLTIRTTMALNLHYQTMESAWLAATGQIGKGRRESPGRSTKTVGVQVRPKVITMPDGSAVEAPLLRRASVLESELSMSTLKVDQREEEIELLLEEKEELKTKHTEDAERLLGNQSQLEDLLSIREEEVETLRANADESSEWQKRTELLSATLIDDNQTLREEHDQLRQRGFDLMGQMSQMTEDLKEKDGVVLMAQGELRASQLELEECKLDWVEEKATLQLAGQQVHLQLLHAETTLEDKEAHLAEVLEDRTRLQQEVDQLKARGFTVLDQLSECNTQLQERDALLLKLHEELREQEKSSDSCIQELSNERAELTLKLQASQTEVQMGEKQLRDTTEKANQIIQTLQDREKDLASQLVDQSNVTQDATLTQAHVQEDLDKTSHELALAKQSVEHAKEQIDLFKGVHAKALDSLEFEAEEAKQQHRDRLTEIAATHEAELNKLKKQHRETEEASLKAAKRLKKEMAELQRQIQVRTNEAQLLIEMERRTRLEAQEDSEVSMLETQDEAATEVIRLSLHSLIHEQQCVRRLRMAQENAAWAELRVRLIEKISNTAFRENDTLKAELAERNTHDLAAKKQLVDLAAKVKEIESEHTQVQQQCDMKDTKARRLANELNQANNQILQLAALKSFASSMLHHMEGLAQARAGLVEQHHQAMLSAVEAVTGSTIRALKPPVPVKTKSKGSQSLVHPSAPAASQTDVTREDRIDSSVVKPVLPTLVSMAPVGGEASAAPVASTPPPVRAAVVVEGEDDRTPYPLQQPQPVANDEHRSASEVQQTQQEWDYSPEPHAQTAAEEEEEEANPEWVHHKEREERLAFVLEATLAKHLNQGRNQQQQDPHRVSGNGAAVADLKPPTSTQQPQDVSAVSSTSTNGGVTALKAPHAAAPHRYDLPETSALGPSPNQQPTPQEDPPANTKKVSPSRNGSESLLRMVCDAAAQHMTTPSKAIESRSTGPVYQPTPPRSAPNKEAGEGDKDALLSILLGHGKVKGPGHTSSSSPPAATRLPARAAPAPPHPTQMAEAGGTTDATNTVAKLLLGGRDPNQRHPPDNGGAVFRAEILDIQEHP